MPQSAVSFDRAVEYYDQTRGFPVGVESQIAELIRSSGGLTRASQVLEIGAGTGRVAVPLAALVGRITAVDLSRGMLNKLAAKPAAGPIDSVEGDITHLPLASASFDAVVAVHILHLLADWPQAIREARRVLRPGAPLICANNGDGGGPDKLGELTQAFYEPLPNLERRRGGASRDPFTTDPGGAGWTPLGPQHSLIYPTARSPNQEYDGYERRLWSSLWALSDAEMALGLRSMRDFIDAQFPDPNAPLTSTASFHVRLYLPNP